MSSDAQQMPVGLRDQALEREAIRDQLKHLRQEIEAARIAATTIPVEAAEVTLCLTLQSQKVDLISYFIGIGGKVLAVPVYFENAINPPTIKLWARMICYVDRWIASSNLASGTPVYVDTPCLRGKDGSVKQLIRLNGPPGEPGEDRKVWKWLFADLADNEDIHTIIMDRFRWGWAGKFGVASLGRGPPDPDHESVPVIFEIL